MQCHIAMCLFIDKNVKESGKCLSLLKEGHARRGIFETVHGTVQTPAFMNVATCAAIKGGVSAFDMSEELHTQVMLCNTYHLHLRPGDELIKT